METQRSKVVLDTGIVDDLEALGYQLYEYTARYILVKIPDGLNMWKIEELEDTLNAQFVQVVTGVALLRWNQ